MSCEWCYFESDLWCSTQPQNPLLMSHLISWFTSSCINLLYICLKGMLDCYYLLHIILSIIIYFLVIKNGLMASQQLSKLQININKIRNLSKNQWMPTNFKLLFIMQSHFRWTFNARSFGYFLMLNAGVSFMFHSLFFFFYLDYCSPCPLKLVGLNPSDFKPYLLHCLMLF